MFSRVMFSSVTDHWSTPEDLFKYLDKEFNFNFDPCPINSLIDGLKISWGRVTFCNPPYGPAYVVSAENLRLPA